MKVLLTADLHNRHDWYRWLLTQAKEYDLVCIAGDLLDMFGTDEQGQIDHLRGTWLPAMTATGTPIALCSGNHDQGMITWLNYVGRPELVVGDGCTQLLTLGSGDPLIVTTCPYYRTFNVRDSVLIGLWEEGARLRDETQSPWLVLHHEPLPPNSSYIATHWLSQRLQQYRPTYVLSGHLHDMDEFAGRRWGAWLFNAGQRLDAPRPNHLILDTGKNTITRVRMVPVRGTLSWVEDRIFDYLET